MVTSFRGFYQFGVMGAVGSLACWAATFTALPALLVLLDRRPGQRARLHRPPIEFSPLGRLLARRSGTITALFTLLAIGGLFGMRHFLKDPFEYDFSKLSANLKTTASAQQFNHSVDHLLVAGRRRPSSSPTASTRWSRSSRQSAAGSRLPRSRRHRTDLDHLGPAPRGPRGPAAQARAHRAILKLTHNPSLELLNAKEKADLAKLDPPEGLHELAPADLRRSPGGRSPRPTAPSGAWCWLPAGTGLSVWSGRDLLKSPPCCSICTCPTERWSRPRARRWSSPSMIRSILRDGPIATAASLIAV